jgi:hypothetical protein
MSRSVKHQAEPMWGKHQAGQDTQGFRLLTIKEAIRTPGGHATPGSYSRAGDNWYYASQYWLSQTVQAALRPSACSS